jgi:hypothetical protein
MIQSDGSRTDKSNLFRSWIHNEPSVYVSPFGAEKNLSTEFRYLQSIRGIPKDVEQKIDLKTAYLIAHLERAQSTIRDGSRKLWVTDTGSFDDPGGSDLDTDITPEV